MNFLRQRLSSSSTSSSSVAVEESMTHHSQQRRLANPNLVFLKRKNEREKRIMEDNSLIFGFENPSRSLCPITADPDNVKFLGMYVFLVGFNTNSKNMWGSCKLFSIFFRYASPMFYITKINFRKNFTQSHILSFLN